MFHRSFPAGIIAVIIGCLCTQAWGGAAPYYRHGLPGTSANAPVAPTPSGNAPVQAPQASLAMSAPAAFAQTATAGSACSDVVVTNASGIPATGLQFRLAKGTDFALCQGSARACETSLKAGGSCNAGVRLAASNPGPKSDTLSVTGNVPVASVNLVGSYENPTVLTFPQAAYAFRYGKGSTITPSVTGGIGPRTFSFAQTPPAGLGIDPATGVITVAAPNATVPKSTVRVQVADANGTTVSGFDYQVLPPMTFGYQAKALSVGVYADASPSVVNAGIGTRYAIQGLSQPTFNGLSIDPGTGRISGTPLEPSSASGLTVVATDPDGSTATGIWRYAVQPPIQAFAATAGVTGYGTPSDDATTLHVPSDGSGFMIPPNGSITVTYAGTYAGLYVSVETGPTAGGRFSVEYLSTSGSWVTTWYNGSQLLGPNSGSGNAFGSNYPNRTQYRGIRVKNLHSATGQLDRVIAY